MPRSEPHVLRFGRFGVHLKAGELWKDGRRLRLQDQPFRVLEALLERPGEVVSRDELRQRLWPADTFVDFDNGLNNCVNKLRAALGDSPGAPTFVETVGRRGYRFIGIVQPGETATSGAASEIRTEDPQPPVPSRVPPEVPRPADDAEAAAARQAPSPGARPRRRRAVLVVALSAVLAVLAVLAASFRASPVPPTVTSLAVLPLVSLSSDPEQEYFSDGMTDALITHLAGIRALRVISRQSTIRLKKTDKPMPDIGRELGVDAIVEGTVLRTGNRVRITAQLVHAPTDRHIWSHEYERDVSDVLRMQSEIARAVAREIHIALRPQEAARLDATATVAPAAYDAYLRGRHLWGRRTESSLRRSLEYFHQAIARDPRFAMAHAAMAETYGPLGYLGFMPPDEARSGMRTAALRAVELDQNLAEGWTALGAWAAFHEWDWSAAEGHFQRAIGVNPNYATTYMWYGLYLENMDRQQENLTMRRRALSLDPLNPAAGAALGSALLRAGLDDEALRQLKSVLELEPGFGQAHSNLGMVHLLAGRHVEAISEFEAVGRDGSLGYAYAVAGQRAQAREVLRNLAQASRTRYVSPYEPALVHAGLGETEDAIAWLERAYDTRAVRLCMIKSDPRFRTLRQVPRFRALVSRMKLAG